MSTLLFPQQFSTHIRVLVVDHDINLLNAIEKLCYQFGYSVETCPKVAEALNLLMEKRDNFDMVLIEAKMPDMDSYDFLQHVRQQINIPVIMMCVDDTKSVVMKAIDNGACDYWIKPLSENLIQNMWQHVARKMWNENKNIESSEKIEFEKRQESVEKINDKPKSSMKKTRFKWSTELHKKFVSVVMELNVDKAVPKKILAKMNVPGLTKEHVASHLQKYRDKLKRGGTKKQKTHIIIAEATTESMISNESSEFDFQAYDASTSQVSNDLIQRNFPHQSNNFIPHESMNIINEAPVNFYQTDYEEDIISAFINQTDIFLANGIIPHQIPMTQSLPMIFENPISW